MFNTPATKDILVSNDIAPPLEGRGPYQLRRLREAEGTSAPDKMTRPSTSGTSVKHRDGDEKRTPGTIRLIRDGQTILAANQGDPGTDAAGQAADMRRPLSTLKMERLLELVPEDSDIPKGLRKPKLIEALQNIGITEG